MTQAEMNFTRDRTRYDQMEEAAIKYHKEHPEIYELFCRFTFDIINRGFSNYGSQSVFERIRWHTDRPDVDGKTTFKVNNNQNFLHPVVCPRLSATRYVLPSAREDQHV